MKKRVLSVLFLVLFLLIACTMLSAAIDREMQTQVIVYEVAPKEAGRYEINIPMWYLFFEDDSIDLDALSIHELPSKEDSCLYQLEERTGWDSGLRAWEVDPNDYFFNRMDRVLSGFDETKGWRFVSYASRQLQPGQKVQITEDSVLGEDYYLVRYPGGVPRDQALPNGITIAAQKKDALVLRLEKAGKPFLYERARRQLAGYGARETVSLQEVDQFLRCLPNVAKIASILITALILWIQSWFLLEQDWENRWILRLNGMMGACLLLALWRILAQIDLPASLLPPENILDWNHYTRQLSPVFDTLREFGSNFYGSLRALGKTGQNTLNLAYRTGRQVKQIAFVGVVLPGLWVSAPWIIHKVRTAGPKSREMNSQHI